MYPKTKKTRAYLAALLLSLATVPLPLGALEISTNLTTVNDYSPAWAFVDFMKCSRQWRTTDTANSVFDSEQSATYRSNVADPNGWPTKIPFAGTDGKQHIIHTLWDTDVLPNGTFNVTFKGQGKVELRSDSNTWSGFDSSNVGDTTTVHSFPMTRTGNKAMYLRVTSSNPNNNGNYIRDIKVIAPNHYNSATKTPTQTFNQTYLDSLAIYQGPVRFMNWGRTNDYDISTPVNTREPLNRVSQSVGAVSIEYMVEMANTLNRDLWYCVPHTATDTYVAEVATVIKNSLNPNLKVWVELSNEIWNPQFNQNKWALAQSKLKYTGPDGQPTDSKWQWIQAEHSARVWKKFRDVFGTSADSRVVRVLAGQGANEWHTNRALNALQDTTVNPHGQFPDVLSPAAYVTLSITPTSDNFDTSDWTGGTSNPYAAWSGAWSASSTNVTKVLVSGSTTDRQVSITNNGSITRTVDTTLSTNNTLGVGVTWSATGLETGEAAYLEVYNPSTATWTTVGTLNDGEDDGTAKQPYNKLVAITPSTATQVRVRLAGNDSNDKLLVHSIKLVGHPSVSSLLASYPTKIEELAEDLARWTKLARDRNATVYCYEGGQHYTAAKGAENDETLVNLLVAMDRRSDMYGLYVDWLDRMQQIGVTGIAHYFDIGTPGKSGTWGAFEKHSDPLSVRHKYRALKEWTPEPVTFHADIIGSYNAPEDLTPTGFAVQDAGATLALTGNTWKRAPYGYRVTAKTRLAFDFKSSVRGEIHGIGLETDLAETPTRVFKLHGTQSYGASGAPAYTGAGAWQPYDIPVGTLAGAISYLVFVNDHDVTSPTATSWFRNVRLYEGP